MPQTFRKLFDLPILYFLCLSFAILFTGISCSHQGFKEKINEGVIIYDITYKNNSGQSFPIQLLPKTLEMKFNENYVAYTIEDRVGLFSISNITDLNNRRHRTLIKVFDKRYVYQGDTKEPPVFFKSNAPFDVEYSSDTCRLAGILCKKAFLTDASTSQIFVVLYSSESGIRNPNYNTPYGKINGLLMQFGIQMKNLDMRLTAKKFNEKDVSDDEFIIPEEYKHINKEQMEEIINTLLP